MREWCKYCGEGDGVCETCGARARIKDLETELSKMRTKTTVMGAEPHWLTKDFNVLYRCAQQLSDACHGRGDGKPYEPLRALDSQLERLKPAFTDTEEVRKLLRERAGR